MDPHVKILNLRTEMRMFDCLKKHFDPRLWKEARQAQGKCAVRLQLPGRCKPGTVCHLYNIDKGGIQR